MNSKNQVLVRGQDAFDRAHKPIRITGLHEYRVESRVSRVVKLAIGGIAGRSNQRNLGGSLGATKASGDFVTRDAGKVEVKKHAVAKKADVDVPPRLVPPLVGSQLYGWGQYQDRAGKKLPEHLDEVLSALRDAGYDYAEGNLDVAKPADNAKFAEQLKKKGLKPV